MYSVEFRTSWADTVSAAQTAFGERGRRMAHLLHGQAAYSKNVIAGHIIAAGYDVHDVLEWAGEPYSSMGLTTACEKLYSFLAEGGDLG